MQRIKWAPGWAWCAAGALLAIGAGVLAYETRGTTFWADEWNWILTRRGGGIGTLLDPHNSHLSLIPVAIYKLLFATAGLRHYWPYRAVLIAAQLGCSLLVFSYARARVGAYLALLATAVILFFGPGWQDILWPFQIAWLISVGTGVGALLALDRGDRRGDVVACVLLTASLASSGAGLAIWIGGLVEVAQRRRWRELWIVGIPIILYGLWWLGYEQSHISGHAFLLLPKFVFTAAAGTLSALSGLANVDVVHDSGTYLTWGPALLAAAVVGVALTWRARGFPRIPPRVLTLASMAVGFWVLTGIGRAYLRVGPLVFSETGDESRYLYVSAILVLLLAIELARGRSPSLATGAVIGLIAAAAILSNITPLRDGAAFLRAQAAITRTELGTLDISRPIANPEFVSNGFVFNQLTAGGWFAAERDMGSDAFAAAQISVQSESVRSAADAQLIAIQGLSLTPATSSALGTALTVEATRAGTVSAHANCVTFQPAAFTPAIATNSVDLRVPPGGVRVQAGNAPTSVGVRRFADQFSPLGTVAAHASSVLDVKADLAAAAWHVQVASSAAFTACGM